MTSVGPLKKGGNCLPFLHHMLKGFSYELHVRGEPSPIPNCIKNTIECFLFADDPCCFAQITAVVDEFEGQFDTNSEGVQLKANIG